MSRLDDFIEESRTTFRSPFPTKEVSGCARYWGSDGTLCSTHHGRFASPSENHCNAASAAEREPDMATAPESIEPRVSVFDGVAYGVTLDLTMHREEGTPTGIGTWHAHLVTGDAGPYLSGSGQTPERALLALASAMSEWSQPMPSDG